MITAQLPAISAQQMIVSVKPAAINAQPPIVTVQRIVVTAQHAISSANVSAIKVEPLALRAEAASTLGLWHLHRHLHRAVGAMRAAIGGLDSKADRRPSRKQQVCNRQYVEIA